MEHRQAARSRAVEDGGVTVLGADPQELPGLAAECVQATVVADGRTIVLLAATRLLSTTEQIALRDLQVEASG